MNRLPFEIRYQINLFIPTSRSRADFLVRQISKRNPTHRSLYCPLCGEPHLKTEETCSEFSNKLWMKKRRGWMCHLHKNLGDRWLCYGITHDSREKGECEDSLYIARFEVEDPDEYIDIYLEDFTSKDLKVTKIWKRKKGIIRSCCMDYLVPYLEGT